MRLTLWFNLLLVFSFTISHSWAINNTARIDSIRTAADSLESPEIYLDYYKKFGEDDTKSFEARIRALEKAAKISLELCDGLHILSIYSHAGFIYREQGKIASSIEIFTKGLKYFDLEGASLEKIDEEAWLLNGYGSLLYKFELYREAKEAFKNSRKKLIFTNSQRGIAVSLNNIGLCDIGLNQLDSALSRFQEAFVIRKKLDEDYLVAHSLIYLSRTYLMLGNERKSDSLLQIAENYLARSKSKNFAIDVIIGWANIDIYKGNYIAANVRLNTFSEKSKAYSNNEWLDTKIIIFRNLGLRDSLFFYAEKGIALGRDISNIEIEIKFLEVKTAAFENGLDDNSDSLKSNIYLLTVLYKKQTQVKDEILRKLFKANQEFIKTRAQNELLKMENLRKSEIIKLQNNSINLTSIFSIILAIGIVVFLILYKNLRKTKNILEVIGERTKVASEAMSNIVISFDSTDTLRYINRAGREYFKSIGIKHIKLNSALLGQLDGSNRKTEWVERLEQLKQDGNSQSISFELNGNNEYYYVYSLTRVLKADGTYAGGIIILNDLTDLQQTSIELAKKSSELKVANDAKERMLSLLAHDLKEGVVSSLEITRLLAKGEFSNAEEKECLSLLEDSLSKTSNLLLKTLEWVKEQSDLSKNRRLSVVLSKLVKDVERSLRDKIEAKNLEVVFDLDANLKVDIDPVLIRSVLRNIIVNAIKFSDKRGSNIHIYSEIEDQDYLVLHIKDQGMGMSKKELNKLTHLDYQDSKQGSAGEKGSGMGLKLVQELLLAHGSPLQVQSVLNQGSDFYFRLPISGN